MRQTFSVEKPGSILFVKPDSAGDLILFVPVLAWLRGHWPETRIGLLLRARHGDVVPLLPPGVIPLYTPANPSDDLVADPAHREALITAVAEFAPEILVASSYEKNWVHGVAAIAAPGARRLSLGPARFDVRSQHYFRQSGVHRTGDLYPEEIVVPRDAHELEKGGLLLRHVCGGKTPALSPRIAVPADALTQARAWLAGKGLPSGGFMVCNPAGIANVAVKGWPPASSATVISWLQAERKLPVLVCAHEDEKPLVDRLLVEIGPAAKPQVWLGQSGEFPMMAGLVSHAKAYFGTDTSTLHVAEAVGIPVAGIYGGGTWPRFRPVGRRSIAIVHPLPCFGCGWDCHLGDAPCVKLVKPDDVITALAPWLSEKGTPDESSRIVPLAHLPQAYLDSIRQGRELYDRLRQDNAARYGQILELTAQVQRSEKDVIALNAAAAALQADVLALQAQIAPGAQRSRAIADESALRHEQILKLTALSRRHADESAARHTQILELTALVRDHEGESAARHAQVLELTALARHHEGESAARHAQVLELTALAQRHEQDIVTLNAAVGLRDQAIQTLQAQFGAEQEALGRQISELVAEREKLHRHLRDLAGELAARTEELATLRENKWVRLGAKIHLIAANPSP